MITTDPEENFFFQINRLLQSRRIRREMLSSAIFSFKCFFFLLFNSEVRHNFTIIKIPDLLKIIPNPYVTQFNCFHYLWSFIILIICVLLLS